MDKEEVALVYLCDLVCCSTAHCTESSLFLLSRVFSSSLLLTQQLIRIEPSQRLVPRSGIIYHWHCAYSLESTRTVLCPPKNCLFQPFWDRECSHVVPSL